MRHGVDGRQFGRNTSHRVAMLRNLANSLIEHDQIITTVQKAKETRRVVERLITLAKKGGLHARRLAFDRTRNDVVVGRLFNDLTKRYESRAGGYTRIVKVSETRYGDGAQMAMIELVDHPEIKRGKKAKAPSSDSKKSDKDSTDAAPSDPFSKMRKVFGKKSGTADKATAPKAAKSPAKRSTPRKTSV